MKRAICFVLCWFALNQISYSQDVGLKELTFKYAPKEWKLFQAATNPFAGGFSTELCVPDSTLIDVNIFKIEQNNNRHLIRRHVSGNRVFSPAVYSLVWNEIDSLDLPVPNGLYLITVKAASPKNSAVVFSDTIKTLVSGHGWTDETVLLRKEDFKVLDNCAVLYTDSLYYTSRNKRPAPAILIPAVRFRKGVGAITNDQLAIRFNFVDTTSPKHYVTGVYSCKTDTSNQCGVKIVKKIKREWNKDFSLIIGDHEYEFILVDYQGCAPVILNTKTLFNRYRENDAKK
jgi:hypothetical protein